MDNSPTYKNTQEVIAATPEIIQVKEDAKTTAPGVLDSGTLASEIEKHQKVIDETTLRVKEVRASLGLSNAETEIPSIAPHQDIISELQGRSYDQIWKQTALERFGVHDFDVHQFKRKEVRVIQKDALDKALQEGKDWHYILDEKNGLISVEETYDSAISAFKAMENLEDKKPGSVKVLHENFGITNFQRYPIDTLLEQTKTPDPEKQTSLLVFSSEDWNGAFDTPNHYSLLSKLYENRKDSSNFRIVECKSKIDLARQLIKAKRDFIKPISFALISAHGNNEGFYLSSNDENPERGIIRKEEIEDRSLEIFTPDAQIITDSCSSGSINGWARTLSRTARIKVTGPDQPAGLNDIAFEGGQIIPSYANFSGIESQIANQYYNGFLLTKK
jgi:hypothetical protein